MSKNQLAESLEPFKYSPLELQPVDYAQMGAAVVGIANEDKYVRRAYGLKTGQIAGFPLVTWSRNNSSFHVVEHEPGNDYALHSIKHGLFRDESMDVIDMYAFGNSPKQGLSHVVHLITDRTFSKEDFLIHAREAGTVTKDKPDMPRLMKLDLGSESQHNFRRSFFSILSRRLVRPNPTRLTL